METEPTLYHMAHVMKRCCHVPLALRVYVRKTRLFSMLYCVILLSFEVDCSCCVIYAYDRHSTMARSERRALLFRRAWEGLAGGYLFFNAHHFSEKVE